jgi:hypothetical protein
LFRKTGVSPGVRIHAPRMNDTTRLNDPMVPKNVRINRIIDNVWKNEEILRIVDSELQKLFDKTFLQKNDVIIKSDINCARIDAPLQKTDKHS